MVSNLARWSNYLGSSLDWKSSSLAQVRENGLFCWESEAQHWQVRWFVFKEKKACWTNTKHWFLTCINGERILSLALLLLTTSEARYISKFNSAAPDNRIPDSEADRFQLGFNRLILSKGSPFNLISPFRNWNQILISLLCFCSVSHLEWLWSWLLGFRHPFFSTQTHRIAITQTLLLSHNPHTIFTIKLFCST